MPYCLHVEIDGDEAVDDKMLLHVADSIDKISGRFEQWHPSFVQGYFSDLSFLLASLAFGYTDVVQKKFAVVSDVVTAGNRTRLDGIIKELPDLCDMLS